MESKLNGIFIIPTGIGCTIGGHAGDATTVAKLIASCCNNLIIHPNVVNGSDINEMTDNMWYVEGSTLDRFLLGMFNLKKKKTHNKILLLVNKKLRGDTLNTVYASKYSLGSDIEIIELKTKLEMNGFYDYDGRATGNLYGVDDLVNQVIGINLHSFDSIAIHSEIEVDKQIVKDYFNSGGAKVNPWGGVEAMISKEVSKQLGLQVAHAPLEREDFYSDEELIEFSKNVSNPRNSAEMISTTYLFSVLKGLHTSPIITNEVHTENVLNKNDIDFMVSPDCWGEPHDYIIRNIKDAKIIIVMENETLFSGYEISEDVLDRVIVVDSYLEAAGIIQCMNSKINYKYKE